MKQLHENFMEALQAQLDPESLRLSKYITKKTFLAGKNFSLKGHEFQKYITLLIENHPGFTFSVSKCSQIGLSELFNRIVLA